MTSCPGRGDVLPRPYTAVMRPFTLVAALVAGAVLYASGALHVAGAAAAQRAGGAQPEEGVPFGTTRPGTGRAAGQDGGGSGNGTPVQGRGVLGQGGGRGFRDRGALPTGTASIRGQVLSSSGAPVRRAQVRATANGAGVARLTSTDVDGRFELRDLPAGQWALTASKPGYVTQRFGQRRPYETVPPIEIADGQRFAGANFALARGGAITGRVFDDFGDPVANARVQVLRSQFVNGRRRLNPVAGSDESDDTGAFRLYGLAPGDYYVSAVLRTNPIESSGDATGYSPTYFPGTGSVMDAQRITLGVGEEQSVSFALLPVRTVSVSGVVVSSTGAPLSGGVVALTGADADDAPLDTATGGRIAANGAFTIGNVAPGSYLLSVRNGGGFGPRGGGGANAEAEVASLPLTVGGQDVSGLVVTTTRGATIDGRVVIDGASTPPNLTSLQITARPLRVTPGGGGRNVRILADGTFRLASLIGPFALQMAGLPSQWVVKSITIDDADVTDSALDLRGNEQIINARVLLTDKISELNGTVTARGQAARDYTVVVFPEETSRWTFPTRYIRTARANQAGGFTLRGLPPLGSYLAVAVNYLEEGESQDPAFLDRMREQATAVALRDGETKTIDLRLIER
jgi:hypothetical protein